MGFGEMLFVRLETESGVHCNPEAICHALHKPAAINFMSRHWLGYVFSGVAKGSLEV